MYCMCVCVCVCLCVCVNISECVCVSVGIWQQRCEHGSLIIWLIRIPCAHMKCNKKFGFLNTFVYIDNKLRRNTTIFFLVGPSRAPSGF